MSINDLKIHSQTYVAGDWTGDQDAIKRLEEWNESSHWGLHYNDVHKKTRSRDSTLNCNIKESLRKRMKVSKTFVLVVGSDTNGLTAGECRYCPHYMSFMTMPPRCSKGYSIDNRSYIKYECDLAIKEGCKIVVLYNSTRVDKSKCPEVLRGYPTHVAMKKHVTTSWGAGYTEWDYDAVKKAITQ